MTGFDKSIERWDWILIIGAILSPMTGLRIAKVGPAEFLCFVWALRNIFTFAFLLSMMVGTFICLVVAPDEFVANGWATWLYLLFIGNALYAYLLKKSYVYLVEVFERICVSSVIWYGALYIFSKVVSKSFLGAPLWYYSRYSGGGTNPHQIAVLFCGIAFWFTSQFLKNKNRLRNIIFFFLAVFIESETKSSTGLAAIAVGAFVLVILFTVNGVNSGHKRKVYLLFEGLVGVLCAVIFYRQIYNVLYEWVASDSNGLGRFYIWSSFKAAFLKSPIFGLGPGMHAISYSGMKEFHNSYLEIFAATGIIGFIAFAVMTIQSVKIIIIGDRTLLPILFSLYMYSMAGFAIRRLAYWIVYVFIIALAVKKSEVSFYNGRQYELRG